MEIYKKIAAVKSEIGTLTKKSDNPFFKSKYLELSDLLLAVEPLLEKHGLLLLQPIMAGKVCSFIHEVEGNEFVESSIELPPITDPQKLGGCITYFRRYTLQSLLSLQAVDDDGNGASQVKKPKVSSANFQKGIDSLLNGDITIEAFDKKLAKFELTDLQKKAILTAKSNLV